MKKSNFVLALLQLYCGRPNVSSLLTRATNFSIFMLFLIRDSILLLYRERKAINSACFCGAMWVTRTLRGIAWIGVLRYQSNAIAKEGSSGGVRSRKPTSRGKLVTVVENLTSSEREGSIFAGSSDRFVLVGLLIDLIPMFVRVTVSGFPVIDLNLLQKKLSVISALVG